MGIWFLFLRATGTKEKITSVKKNKNKLTDKTSKLLISFNSKKLALNNQKIIVI